ncbi:hypothetical protein NDU88_008798 [Pleurodeles waltl]|uniref:Uncharacterized protein n=1 Tax=Pleurodeles waltl TaxID=8319 RepID=A0AAV7NX63_PLEWA|nr:hypothetical protein NDU88_008798 [Pleurodeles waltl]
MGGHSPLEQEDGGGSAGDGLPTWEGCLSHHDPPDVQDPGVGVPGVGWALEGITAATRGTSGACSHRNLECTGHQGSQCGTEPQHRQSPTCEASEVGQCPAGEREDSSHQSRSQGSRWECGVSCDTFKGGEGAQDTQQVWEEQHSGEDRHHPSCPGAHRHQPCCPGGHRQHQPCCPGGHRHQPTATSPAAQEAATSPAGQEATASTSPAAQEATASTSPAAQEATATSPPPPSLLPRRPPPAPAQLPRRPLPAPALLPRGPPPSSPLGHEGPPVQAPLGHEGPPAQTPLNHEGPPAQFPLGHEGPLAGAVLTVVFAAGVRAPGRGAGRLSQREFGVPDPWCPRSSWGV